MNGGFYRISVLAPSVHLQHKMTVRSSIVDISVGQPTQRYQMALKSAVDCCSFDLKATLDDNRYIG
jgi:hypothetical protein